MGNPHGQLVSFDVEKTTISTSHETEFRPADYEGPGALIQGQMKEGLLSHSTATQYGNALE